MAAPLMQMGVLITPYVNQQGFNAMAKSQGANFAAQFNSGMVKAAQPLGRITGQISEFEKSMAAANARVLAFGASAGSIYLVKDAFEKMISSTIEVEKSLTNINAILQLGKTALNGFSSEMFKAASQTGQTFETASKVALEFARHGVSATETAKRMTSAMQLMRISGLSAQESVNAITAAINAFNREGLSSEDIVNRLTAVDTKFAVSANDLAKAIERVGSTAVEAGVKFNQLLGLVTAVQTATARGGAVIGNAFKSIFTRLARPEVLSDLESIGVTTKTASGQIIPMVDLLKRLASQYNTLNYAQKSFITEAVGGVYQVNILKASLTDLGRGFSIYDKAAIAASNSTGLIDQRMNSLNDTISSKLNTTTLQFTRLVSSFGQVGFGAGAKSGLDSFNKQIEMIGNGLDEVADNSSFGDKIGHSMAQGITKGLGDIVSGPGIQIAIALISKIAKGLGSFAYQSSKEFMGLNEPAKQQAAVQQSITGFLQQNVGLVNQWAKGQVSLNSLVGVYLQSMKNASIMQGQMANMVGGISPLASPSVHVSHATPSSGFIPSFGIPNAQREYVGALAGGYKPGKIYQEHIEGLGYVTMNDAETVKHFDGMSQKAILPPRNSKAGSNYKNVFKQVHGFDPYASDGYVPNFGLMNMLGGLGGIGGNLLAKQNLPANISEEEMEKIYQHYAVAMYNPAAGKTPLGFNQFANKAFNSSFVEKNGNYVFGQHDNNVFLPTHFAPKSKMGGLSIIKDMKSYDNIVMAVTKDLSALLQKTGYSTLKENVPVSYRGGEAMKDILVSNKIRTPVLGAGMFTALATGNAKSYFAQHGGRTDKSDRQFYWGEMGKTHNAVNYMHSKGLLAAEGIIPNLNEKKMGKMQELRSLYQDAVNKKKLQEDYYVEMVKFHKESRDAGFNYVNFSNRGFVDSIMPFGGMVGKDVYYRFDVDKLKKSGISFDYIKRLAARKGKFHSEKGAYHNIYDIDRFQKIFAGKKRLLGIKGELSKQTGLNLKGKDDLDDYIKTLINPESTTDSLRYNSRSLQEDLNNIAFYGDKADSWDKPSFQSSFKKGVVGGISNAISNIFGLDKKEYDGRKISTYLSSERQVIRNALKIRSHKFLSNPNYSSKIIAQYMGDPLIQNAERREETAKTFGIWKKVNSLKELIPLGEGLPSKSDIISGKENYIPGMELVREAAYIKSKNSRDNSNYIKGVISSIIGHGGQEFESNPKNALQKLPEIFRRLLPKGVQLSNRAITRNYVAQLRNSYSDNYSQFTKGEEYKSKAAEIYSYQKKLKVHILGMRRELLKPTANTPPKWTDKYFNPIVTPAAAFGIIKRNLDPNIFRGIASIEKNYSKTIGSSDFVFRGAHPTEFALLNQLGEFTSIGQRTDEKKAGAYVSSSLMKAAGYAISSPHEGKMGAVGIYSREALKLLGPELSSAASNEEYNSSRFAKLSKSALIGVLDLESGKIMKLKQYLSQFGSKLQLNEDFVNFNKQLNQKSSQQILNMQAPSLKGFSGSGNLDLFRKILTRNTGAIQPSFRGPSTPMSPQTQAELLKAEPERIIQYLRDSLSSTQPGVISFGSDASSVFDLRKFRPISRKFRKAIENERLDLKNFSSVIYHKQVPVGSLINPERLKEFTQKSEKEKLIEFHKGLVFDLGSFRNQGLINNQYEQEKEYPILTFGGQVGQKFDIGKILAVSTSGNRRKSSAMFSAGFVPNFGNPIFEAFKRENSPTAALGFSSEVASSNNPMGAMVYDKAYQSNPEEAFKQHALIGQTDFKNMGKAQGFVPNFSIGDSLILGALQGTFNNMNGILTPLSYNYNKQLELVRKMNEQYSALTSQIKSGAEVKYNGTTYNNKTSAGGIDILQNLRDFAVDFRKGNQNYSSSPQNQGIQNKDYEAYHQRVQKGQQRLSTYATYGMVGAPLAMETASSVAKNFGKLDLSKGLEEFSSGITTAGQLLSTFPNKLGVMLASTEVIKSLSDSVALFMSGFGKYEKDYDLASSKAEKMASAGNAVLDTFERLKNATTDATVSLDEYQSLQRKYAESLVDLASIQPNAQGKGGGAEIVRQIETAGTADQKQMIISRAVDFQNRQKGEAGIKMQLSQLTAASSVGPYNYGKGRIGGIFAATSDQDALDKQQILSSTAGQMMQGSIESQNLPKGFAERMKKGGLTDQDVSAVTSEAKNSSILNGLDQNSITQIMQQFAIEINKFKVPDGVSADNWEKHIELLQGLNSKEASLRLKYNQELQNALQKGAILANFSLTTGAGNIESNYRKNSLGTFAQNQQANLSSLTTAEIPMIIRRSQIKGQEIQNETGRELGLNENKAREISNVLSKTITEALTGGLQMTGQKQDVASLSDARVRANAYLATRQNALAQSPSALLEAAKNPETFAQTVLGGKGAAAQNGITSAMYDTIANRLSAAVNGQQETITNVLEETKQITEKGLADLMQVNLEQVAAIKEARFQELAQGIKGIDELARGGARKAHREIRRDEFTMEHGRNAIRRGEAARDLLNYIPTDQRDYNNPQIKHIYDTAQTGSAAAFNYIYRGTGLQRYANSDERSFSRTFGNYKGVNTPSLGFSESELNGKGSTQIDISGFQGAVNTADDDLTKFGKSLDNIGTSLDKFKLELDSIQTAKDAEEGKYDSQTNAQNNQPAIPRTSGLMDNVRQYVLPALNALAQLAFIAASFRKGGGGGKIAESLTNEAGQVVSQIIKKGKVASTAGAFGRGLREEPFIGKAMAGQAAGTAQRLAYAAGGKLSPISGVVTEISDATKALNRGLKGGKFISPNMAGQAAGTAQRLAYAAGGKLSPISGVVTEISDATKALNRGLKGGKFISPNMAGQAAGTLQKTTFGVGSSLREIGQMANPIGGWSNVGKVGKALKIGGIVGAGFSAYEAAGQFSRGQYARGAVNLGTTALSFAGPIGLAGAAGVNAVQAETDKLMDYHQQIGNEKVRGVALDTRLASINKFKGRYKTAINKGINATPEDKDFIKGYEKLTGSSASKTKQSVIQSQMMDYFNSKKGEIKNSLIHPVGTFEKNGNIYGYSGGSNIRIGGSSDTNRTQEINNYTSMEEARRNTEIQRLSHSKQGLDYLAAQDKRAQEMAEDLTAKKFEPEIAERSSGQSQANQNVSVQQDVKISAEPATVIVKLAGSDGTILQTILTKIAFMESKINDMAGTPKPASVNSVVSP